MAKLNQLYSNQDNDEQDFLNFKKDAEDKGDHMSKMFAFKDPSEEPEDNFRDMKEAFRAITDQQFMKMMEKEGDYSQEIRENVGKSVKGSRNKFRNK